MEGCCLLACLPQLAQPALLDYARPPAQRWYHAQQVVPQPACFGTELTWDEEMTDIQKSWDWGGHVLDEDTLAAQKLSLFIIYRGMRGGYNTDS